MNDDRQTLPAAGLTEEMLAALDQLLLEEGIESPDRITERAERAELPPSFAQQRLWLLYQLEPGSAAYNVHAAVRLKGRLDAAALARSLTEVVRRHESLRTNFLAREGGVIQRVNPARACELPVTDLRQSPRPSRETELRRLMERESRSPFDLSRDPLFRPSLFRLEDDEHALSLTMHHIVSDAWSIGLLVRELKVLYKAFAEGAPSPLPELPIQYADFTLWQRERLRGGLLEEQLAYWKKQLGGGPPALDLPSDRPRPAAQTYGGAQESRRLSRSLTEGLKRLGGRENATLFMTLLAAFKALLRRYTGARDISVGTPIAGRNRMETEALIGFFVNTLVMRTAADGDPTFTEWLRRVRRTALDAYAHQDIPFERLVEELRPERVMSRTPLFQVMFALQNTPRESLSLPGLSLSLEASEHGSAKFDLTLMMAEGDEGLEATFKYSTDLFEATTIRRMLRHFETLLEGIVGDPGRRLSELPLLGEGERRQITEEWNRTAASFPHEKCLHELFEEQAARTPDAPAVACAGRSLSYAELDARADRLALRLRSLGVGPESVVGLLVGRSAEMVVALLGVLKAGAAYLPLEPGQPRERQALMLEEAGVRVLLTDGGAGEGWRRGAVRVVVEMGAEPEEVGTRGAAVGGAAGANLAYVIYTSGSTGRPKGVAITHRSLVNYTRFVLDNLIPDARAGEEQLQFASVSTIAADLGNTSLFPSLISGGCLHLLGYEVATDAGKFAQYFERHRIDVLKIVPSHLSALLGAAGSARVLPRRRLILGGEKLSNQLLRRIALSAEPPEIINHYGPTEATVGALTCNLGDGSRAWWSSDCAPIGRPGANMQVYLLDEWLKPVAVGMTGEIYICGEGVGRGYVNQPAATAEKFIPHPFSREPGARLYRTGDSARYLEGGHVEFLGRVDDQVKVRGYRVELGEVEAALGRDERVREAVVVAREDASGEQRLVAYVVLRDDAARAGDEGHAPAALARALRGSLKERLPEYMIPSSFVRLEQLPLSANGKVARRALPEPPRIEDAGEYVAPRTPTEEAVARVWAEVLRLERVSVRSNFFELGGHSLLATQVVSRVRETCGVELPLRLLFETPTVEGLAEAADMMCWAADGAPAASDGAGRERVSGEL